MNVTSETAATVAQDLLDAQEEANRKIDGAKNQLPPWAVVLVIALVVVFLLVRPSAPSPWLSPAPTPAATLVHTSRQPRL